MSPESVLGLRHFRLSPFVRLPQLSFLIASLFEIDNDISLLQNLLLTLPRPHPQRPECLSDLAGARLLRYTVSDECGDLDKTISHSTEAILLPSDTPIELPLYVVESLFDLAKGLFLRGRKLKQPDDVKYALEYLRYLKDQLLETPNLTRGKIKAFLVWALVLQIELKSVDPMRDITEAAALCRELLTSGVEESLLITAVNALAAVVLRTIGKYWQPPPDGAIDCLREARIRLPTLKKVRRSLANSLIIRFVRAHTHDDYEEAMSNVDERIADPNEDVEHATSLARALARFRFTYDSKPEYLAEAIFRTRTYLNAMSSEHPRRPSVMRDLAGLEKERLEAFGIRSDLQDDSAEVVDDSHLNASPQMAKSHLIEFPLPMPDESDPVPHLKALYSIFKSLI